MIKGFSEYSSLYQKVSLDVFEDRCGYFYSYFDVDCSFPDEEFSKRNWVDFTDDEVEKVSGLFSYYYIRLGYQFSEKDDFPLSGGFSKGFLTVTCDSRFVACDDAAWNDTIVYIVKLVDEWYYLFDYRKLVYYSPL